MAISTGTGIVLDMFVSRYDGYALLAIIIGGKLAKFHIDFLVLLSNAIHRPAWEYRLDIRLTPVNIPSPRSIKPFTLLSPA